MNRLQKRVVDVLIFYLAVAATMLVAILVGVVAIAWTWTG